MERCATSATAVGEWDVRMKIWSTLIVKSAKPKEAAGDKISLNRVFRGRVWLKGEEDREEVNRPELER